MRDLLSLSCSEAICSRLNVASSYIYKQAGALSSLAVSDPQKTLEKIRELQDELNNAFLEIKADLATEAERRKPKADDPSSACVGETTDQIAARSQKPKLYEPDADAFSDPVGSGIVGNPVPQSDRTGA